MLVVRGAHAVVGRSPTVADEVSDALVPEVVCDDAMVVDEPPARGTEFLDATDCVVTPGLVNAHHHLLQTAFRTLPGTRGVPDGAVAADDGRGLRRGRRRRRARQRRRRGGAGRGAAVRRDDRRRPPPDLARRRGRRRSTWRSATAGAAERLGARLVFVRGAARDDPRVPRRRPRRSPALVPSAPGGVRADGLLQLAVGPAGRAQRRARDVPAAGRGRARGTACGGAPRPTSRSTSTSPLERYGRRPLDLLDEWGWLAPDVTLAHLCDVTDDEIAASRPPVPPRRTRPGATCRWAGASPRWRRCCAAGIAVGLGTSGGGSNDAGHLLADARLAMQVSAAGRAASSPRATC